MNLSKLIEYATNKSRFQSIDNYFSFCSYYLDFIETGIQARIVSQNENHYQFLQYKEDGSFNISRPLNTNLMYTAENFSQAKDQFIKTFKDLKDGDKPKEAVRNNINCTIYTLQQAIGATLDALEAGKSNTARKINGDLFERLIRLIIVSLGIDCVSGTMQVPVVDDKGNELFNASYQHDLLLSKNNELKIIGSVKTSSKDRIDKVFMDKFLYNKLTDTNLPHIAIFLNDVQRKNTRNEKEYGINSTFLPGHFKAYTIKLISLDGVYYCDIRPNMVTDPLLSKEITTIDNLFMTDLFALLNKKGQTLEEIKILPDKGLMAKK